MDIEHYTDMLRQVVNIDCGTGTPRGVAQVADIFNTWWRQAGWHVQSVALGDQCGPGLLVTNRADAEHYDVLLIGHLDTVFPEGTAAARPMSQDENCLYGPGVSDMKGGLLNIFHALTGLEKEHRSRLSIAVAMNPDEETGSGWSGAWLRELALRARRVLVCEAARADGSLVHARKGMASYQIDFHGVAAHAGNEPEKGRSAITTLAWAILAINALADPTAGTTLNVGIVQGGDGANIVASHARAVVDVRFWQNPEYARIDSCLHSLCNEGFDDGVTLTLRPLTHKPAMAGDKQTDALMRHIERAGERTGIPVTWKAVGGGSDANLTAALGVPTIDGLGPVGGGFHSPEEYLETASIAPRIALLQEIIRTL